MQMVQNKKVHLQHPASPVPILGLCEMELTRQGDL
jgi:hypothetical protein